MIVGFERGRSHHVFVLGILAAIGLGFARDARALTSCTAANVTSQDPGCPASQAPCNITQLFDVGNGCTLDFGTRAVTVSASGEIDIASGSVTIKAGSFTIAGGGHVEGRGTGSTAPTNRGGMLTIEATGNVGILQAAAAGVLDLSGNAQGGTALIVAGGTFTLTGRLESNQLTTSGGGGFISVRSTGDLVTATGSSLQATGGNLNGGGAIDLSSAQGKVDLGDMVDVGGGEGGSLDVFAVTDIIVRRVNATGVGDAGSGGCLGFSAGRALQFLGLVTANGTTSGTGFGGGCGGFLDAESRYGNLTVSDDIQCEGAPPDGGGGDISLFAKGTVNVGASSSLSVRGTGTQGCGGEAAIDADLDAILAGSVDTSGGFGGNFFDITAGRNVTISGRVDLNARSAGGFAGGILAEAGAFGSGTLSITNTIDGTGGPCTPLDGCGAGGFTDLTGCNVTIGPSGVLDVRAPEAGQNLLTAREQLTVQGTLNANSNTGTGLVGENRYVFRSGHTPIVTGTVTPTAIQQPLATCSQTVQSACLVPCPTCGNGIIEYPETCDTVGTPTNCDGCTSFCRIENCDDNNVCTAESCDPTIGCRHDPTRNGLSCSDVCHGLEFCRSGFCTAPLCFDDNLCTRDVCDPVLGCSNPPVNAGTACDDDNPCMLGETCDGLGTCQPGTRPRICNDNRECTTDSCNPLTPIGCVFTNRTGTCTADGNACTNDLCEGANCTHTTIPGCTTTTTTTTTTSSTTTTTRPPCRLDVDGNGQASTATDVVYIARRLFGIPPVPPSFRVSDPTIPPDATIIANITALGLALDVDGNGQAQTATDVVYIARRLFGIPPVPPSFRVSDPTIPPDATIIANITALCPR